jgi:chorismate synthase
MELTEADIQPQMTRRRPGQSNITTPRNEKDRVVIQSGTEFGVTLGTPIGMIVLNEDQRPKGVLPLLVVLLGMDTFRDVLLT